MLALSKGFHDRANKRRQSNSATIDPVVMATKFGAKSAITRPI